MNEEVYEDEIQAMFVKKGMEGMWYEGHAWDIVDLVVDVLNAELRDGWSATGPSVDWQKTWIWFHHPCHDRSEKLERLPEETKAHVMRIIERLQKDGVPFHVERQDDDDWSDED
jgi:hypothetical protein